MDLEITIENDLKLLRENKINKDDASKILKSLEEENYNNLFNLSLEKEAKKELENGVFIDLVNYQLETINTLKITALQFDEQAIDDFNILDDNDYSTDFLMFIERRLNDDYYCRSFLALYKEQGKQKINKGLEIGDIEDWAADKINFLKKKIEKVKSESSIENEETVLDNQEPNLFEPINTESIKKNTAKVDLDFSYIINFINAKNKNNNDYFELVIVLINLLRNESTELMLLINELVNQIKNNTLEPTIIISENILNQIKNNSSVFFQNEIKNKIINEAKQLMNNPEFKSRKNLIQEPLQDYNDFIFNQALEKSKKKVDELNEQLN